jgi:hypothetical protein
VNRKQRREARRMALDATMPLVDQMRGLGPCPDYGPDVHTVEQAAAVARARVAWQGKREVIMAAHRKRSRVSDAEVLQERHSPTVEISVDDPAGNQRARRNVTRIRKSESWRHNTLTAMQRQAESEMILAWQARTVGLAVSRSNLDGVRAGRVVTDPTDSSSPQAHRLAELDDAWRGLVIECRRERIPFAVVVAVLTEPRTLGEIDRQFRLRVGASMFEYVRALDAWSVLRGWSKSTYR